MPYVNEGALNVPPQETKIWRYMDFTKFVNLIGTRKLFLCKADCLGDPEEGRLSDQAKDAIENPAYVNPEITPELGKFLMELALKSFNDNVYINCWHMNDRESDAMWGRYAGGRNGIAIQSTIQRLIESTSTFNGKLRIGSVRYTDYKEIGPEGFNPLTNFTRKRTRFDHEKEVRLLYVRENSDILDCYGDGVRINVDTENLIERVYLPPKVGLLEVDTVKLAMSTYNIDKEIIILDE